MGFFVAALFLIAGIVGLSIETYFGAQTLVSIILIVVGAVPILITLLIFFLIAVGVVAGGSKLDERF